MRKYQKSQGFSKSVSGLCAGYIRALILARFKVSIALQTRLVSVSRSGSAAAAAAAAPWCNNETATEGLLTARNTRVMYSKVDYQL